MASAGGNVPCALDDCGVQETEQEALLAAGPCFPFFSYRP